MPQHHGDLRHAHLGQRALVAKDAPGRVAVGKQIGLQRQETTSAVAQVNHGQAVLDRDVQRAHDLLDRQRVPGAALDAGVIRVDDDLAAVHDADARDLAGAVHVTAIRLVGGQGTNLQKRCARVEQQFQALAHGELLVFVQAVDVALRPHVASLVQAFVQLLDALRHGGVVLAVAVRACVQAAVDAAHAGVSSGRTRASTAPR
ncbi:hypothetical protein D9M68_752020 [compost metagenome]